MLSKKSKIEQLPKSRERQCLPAAASASFCQTRTKLCGRLLVIRCGPSHRRARHAPAVPKNLVRLPEKPFSTASTRRRLSAAPTFDARRLIRIYPPVRRRLTRRQRGQRGPRWCIISPLVGAPLPTTAIPKSCSLVHGRYLSIFDNLCPIRRFCLDLVRKLRRRTCHRRYPDRLHLVANICRHHDPRSLLVEPSDDRLGRAGRHKQAEPRRNVEAGETGFIHGREIGEEWHTRQGGDRKRPDFSLPQQREARGRRDETHRNASAHEVSHDKR